MYPNRSTTMIWATTLLARGTPVLGWTGEYSRVISREEIGSADSECVVVASCAMDLAATRASIDDLHRSSSAWRELVRDRRRRVVALDGNQFANRPGPRLIETAELFAAAIHPKFFESYARAARDARKLDVVEVVTA